MQSVMKIMPQQLVASLLSTEKSLLFIRICKFDHINRFFSELEDISQDNPKDILRKLENILHFIQTHLNDSKCKNICILWAYRLMKSYRLQSAIVDRLCQQIVQNYKGKLSEDFLVIQ